MSSHPKTIKVKPWGEGQGDHVLINEEDFDEDFHELLDGAGEQNMTIAKIKAALAEKNITIPDGVTRKADLQALLDGAVEHN